MVKHKPGLHKEISSIFDGVPVAGKQDQKPGLRKIGCDSQQQPVTAAVTAQTAVLETKEEAKVEAPKITQIGKPAKTETPVEPVVKIIEEKPVLKQESFISKKIIAPLKAHLKTATLKNKIMCGLIPVLAIGLFLLLANNFKTAAGNKSKITPMAAVVTTPKEVKIEWQIPDPFPSNLRDPMSVVQNITVESDETVLLVSGILYSLEKSQAVVNGQIVEKGDKINGAEVVDITRDSLMFKKDEKTWVQKVGNL